MKYLLLSFSFICVCGCSNAQLKEKNILGITASDTTIHSISNTVIIPPKSGIVNVTLTNGEGNYIIRKQEDQIIYLTFESEGKKELNAELIPLDSNANIRFTQIVLPNGMMDGPFGRELNYKLPYSGQYKISLHENMMAGGPWDGEFVVKLHLHDQMN